MSNVSVLFDPGKTSGAILDQLMASILVIVVLAVLGWLFGPVKWWWGNRRIKNIVRNRRSNFVFNPANPDHKCKPVTFLPTGQIGEGQNDNEHSWHTKRGQLEVFSSDGKLYSRFRLDPKTGLLVSTNDPKLRSICGQYFEVVWQRAARNQEN
jgi:hypothetical protein